MDKIKYDSLYKFIVSIGIVLVILPFIIFFSILNNNDIILLKENEINQLTDIGKEIVQIEQYYKYMFLQKIYIYIVISISIIILGVALIIIGIFKWRNKVQKYEDKSRELSNSLLELQLKGLTTEEKEERIIDSIVFTPDEKLKFKMENENDRKEKITEYMKSQDIIYHAIEKEFKNYKVFRDVKMDNQIFDCIAMKQDQKYGMDYIFEIKFIDSIASVKNNIQDYVSNLENKESVYLDNTDRVVKTVLIFVLEKYTEKDKLENNKLLKEVHALCSNDKRIIFTDINKIEYELISVRSRLM